MNLDTTSMLRDGEELAFKDTRGQEWLGSWHSGAVPPEGKWHGAEGICFTPEGLIILVTEDGMRWVVPGGRPEGDEDWRDTLDREVLEEACAQVETATLLGFARGLCLRGEEAGLVLVRSWWRTTVSLQEWNPQYEIKARRLVSVEEFLDHINGIPLDQRPIHLRIFHEALKLQQEQHSSNQDSI